MTDTESTEMKHFYKSAANGSQDASSNVCSRSERKLRARARKLGYRILLRNLDGSYTLRVWPSDVAVFHNATLAEIENFLAAGRLEAEQTK